MTQPTSEGMQGLYLRVFGRIQGVGFRAWTRRQALRLGVTGWVRNEADGTVSCECRGTEEALAAFAETLRRGPPLARVDKIDMRRVSGTPAHRRFEII
ncbi:MAG: acylphosphatase [Spirochaetaceae bacterium]|nr:acylphosphatase [Spirochaetaceae bacterium]